MYVCLSVAVTVLFPLVFRFLSYCLRSVLSINVFLCFYSFSSCYCFIPVLLCFCSVEVVVLFCSFCSSFLFFIFFPYSFCTSSFMFLFFLKKVILCFCSLCSSIVAFCQGLAFDLCVSTLLMKKWKPPSQNLLRILPTLAPSALDTRASRSWLISHGPCSTETSSTVAVLFL